VSARTTYRCDYHPVEFGQEREEAVAHGEFPLGWWEVPGKGRNSGVGHACPDCVMNKPGVSEDITQRRGAALDELLGKVDGSRD
jgi:hypothetical protein